MDDFKDFGSPLLNDPVLGGLELNEFLDEYSATDFNFDVDTMFDQLPENKPLIPAEDHDYDLPHGSPGSDRSGPSTSGSSCSASTIDSGYTSSPNSKNLFFDILDAASNEISEFKGEPKEEPEDVPSSPTDGYSSPNRQYIFANCNNGSRPNGTTATTTRRYVTGGNSVHPRAPIRTTVRFKPAPRHAVSSGGNTVRSTAGNAERYQQNAASTEFTSAAGGNAQRKYPALILTEEEKRLCKKEGIVLPEHYPLTKSEERELKRIRRKIRNKKSAQTSRRRKQDYIEALEDRVDHCTQENCELKRQIELLSRENQNILAQLRKVQASLSNSTKRSTQAGTCLAVLLLSVCLLVAPNLSPLSQSNQVGQNDSMEDVATADNNAAVAAAMADAQAQLHAVHMHNTYEEFQQQHEEMSNHEHYYNFKQSPFVGKSRTLMDFVHPNRQDICAEKIAIVDSPHKEHHYVEEESIAEIYAVNKNEQRAPKQRQPYSYKRQYVNDQQPIIIESGKVMAPLVVDGANLMPRQPSHQQAIDTPIRLVPARLVNATEGFNGMEPQRKRYRY